MAAFKKQYQPGEFHLSGNHLKDAESDSDPKHQMNDDSLQTMFRVNSMIDNGKPSNEIIYEFLRLLSANYKSFHLLFLSGSVDKGFTVISTEGTTASVKKDDISNAKLTGFFMEFSDIKKVYSYTGKKYTKIFKNLSLFFMLNVESLLIKPVFVHHKVSGYLLLISATNYIWKENEIEFIKNTGELIKNIFNLLNIHELEEILLNTEDQYKTLFSSMRRGVVFQDAHGIIFDANSAAEKILGLSTGELAGMTLTDSIWNTRNLQGSGISKSEHLCSKVLEKKIEIRDNLIMIQNQSTDKTKWLSISSFPEFDLNTGKLIRLFTVFDDITQQRQLIEELQISEDKYRKLVDHALVGIYQTTIDGDILYVNQAAARMFEYGTQLNLTHANILFKYINTSDRDRLFQELKENDGKIENFELSLKTNKNRIIDVIINGILKDNIVSGMIVDITEMKRATAELKLNEERLESLLKLHEYPGTSDEDISGFALDEAVKITVSKVGYLHFINEDQKTIRLNTWSTETLKHCTAGNDNHYPIDQAGIWVEAFYLRKPVIHNNYQDYTEKKGYPEGHIHLERHLSVPVFDGKNIVAIAGVGNKTEPYTDGDVRQFSLFMNSMWGILKRTRAEKALKESEEIYRSFVQNFQGIAFRVKPDWSPVFFHGFVEKLSGYTEKELLSRNPDWMEIIHPEDSKNILEKYTHEVFLMPDFTAERNYRIIRKDGEIRWVRDVVHTQFDTQGNPVFINGVILDISASKQTEEEFETLFNISSDLICVASIEGYFLKINPAFSNLLGYSDKELKSKPYIEFVVEEDKQKTLDIINEELRMGKTVINFQNRYMCKDGHLVWLDWNSRPIPEINLTFAVARDITLQKHSEEDLNRMMQELERSNHDLEEFAYVASHDLQEPLRNIKSFTELFAKKFKGNIDETADKYINYIIDGTARMQNLIKDLLALSRITTKGKAFELTDIGECIQNAIENLKLQVKENNTKIYIDKMPELLADSTQMIQLFQNFISNAIKFRNKDIEPQIHIEVKEKVNLWQFKVKDNGIGFEMKYADRIFIIFQRLHTRKEYPGTGIGLALCKKIVERHGGKIKVKSSPGKGTIFKFTMKKR